jgi:hypothetical protein
MTRPSSGWILGHLSDGTQAEYVLIPQADAPGRAGLF